MGKLFRETVATWMVGTPIAFVAIVLVLPFLGKAIIAVSWLLDLIAGRG